MCTQSFSNYGGFHVAMSPEYFNPLKCQSGFEDNSPFYLAAILSIWTNSIVITNESGHITDQK